MGPAPLDLPDTVSMPDLWRVPPQAWRGLSPQLRRLRRLLLAAGALPAAALAALVGGTLLGPPGLLAALAPLGAAVWAWHAIGRAWDAWRYAERDDDLLVQHGVLVRRLAVVPYGRMQLVDVTAGPLARRFGVAQVRLHTAAATTDAVIPGLAPAEAARLRDALAERGRDRAVGL
ncbi:PH domain-containing protein [Parafrankia sp. FMc2]|uniref:PH domain-containing protein n=1 Tax=Parafrankia sp. FMc2 TaxID=3233196 RepID=UPI003B58A127